MAGHPLICAELSKLAARLPSDVVDELADGLLTGYDRHRAAGLSSEQAARVALTEFGDAQSITRAFIRASPAARIARMLLASGPVVGGLWGATLLAETPWPASIPWWARLSVGGVLLGVVAALAFAAGLRCSYRSTSTLALVGTVGLLGLDGLMLLAAASLPLVSPWPMGLAVAASLARMAMTVRALTAVVARP